MSKVFGRDLALVRVLFLVILGTLVAGTNPVLAAENAAPEAIEKPLPEACGLLDDPEKRAIMEIFGK